MGHERINWFDIDRTSPVVKEKIGLQEVDLTYQNTTVFKYPEAFQDIDHIYVMLDDGERYLFEVPELIDSLVELRYPTIFQAFPHEEDVNTYFEWQEAELSNAANSISPEDFLKD